MRVSEQGCYLEADRPRFEPTIFWVASECSTVKPAFHDADTDPDILARILAPTRPTRAISWRYSWTTRRHPREDVGVNAGVVECGLYVTQAIHRQSMMGDCTVRDWLTVDAGGDSFTIMSSKSVRTSTLPAVLGILVSVSHTRPCQTYAVRVTDVYARQQLVIQQTQLLRVGA